MTVRDVLLQPRTKLAIVSSFSLAIPVLVVIAAMRLIPNVTPYLMGTVKYVGIPFIPFIAVLIALEVFMMILSSLITKYIDLCYRTESTILPSEIPEQPAQE